MASRFARLGRFDCTTMGTIPQEDQASVEALANIKAVREAPLTNQYLFLNTRNLSDVRVRQAILYAIDRNLLLTGLLEGRGEVVDGFLSSYSPYYDSAVAPIAYDPAKAKALLAEAGWDSSRRLTFLVDAGDATFVQASSVIVAQLAEVGIQVDVRTVDFASLWTYVANHEFDFYSVQYTLVPADPLMDISWLVSGGDNYVGYVNDTVDQALASVGSLKTNDELKAAFSLVNQAMTDAATWQADGLAQRLTKAASVGVLATADEDVRSLREMIIYGVKGLAAYAEHAARLGFENPEIYAFVYEALAATLDDKLTADQLVALTLRTGEFGVQTMALLDKANTSRFGKPEITSVDIGVRTNPAILISGHDLADLEQLLQQTQDTGVDVYTHSEMLPAHYYPAFKKYPHFAGNYGNAWWKQLTEFESFHGPILFTTNCIVPPKSEEVRARIFTTGASGYPGCRHIEPDSNGHKDFSEIIALAKTLPPPEGIETGSIVGGFAHDQVLALAEPIVAAVKSGAIRKFFVMAGCDGRMSNNLRGCHSRWF